MNWLWASIGLPVAAGLICLAVPRRMRLLVEALAVVVSSVCLGTAVWIFIRKPLAWSSGGVCFLRVEGLNGFILLAAGLFGFLIALYSLRFMNGHGSPGSYYGCILLSLGCTFGALLSNHWILFLVFWGMLGILLYVLVLAGGEQAAQPAKKTLILIGGSDALMLLGIALLYMLTSTVEMDKGIGIPLRGVWRHTAFFSLVIAAFAKAGAMPFHTWIPDAAEAAPIPVTAFLPAALDKLLGIYLFARLCLSVFALSAAVHTALMVIGTLTILAAVMMALVQHDFRRLLAYHAVSQVGYMVLGVASGNTIGAAGGLFHMLNHSIYKASLFLTGGAVMHRTGETELDRLGGLGKTMPLTFACFLVSAFSISGIPPFNGFVSKWMVYQGLIEAGRNGDALWVVWLISAMFGSALTLASFMKLAHAIFLGIPSHGVEEKRPREVGLGMAVPMLVLAGLCVVFGVFAFPIPVRHFLIPSIGSFSFRGLWMPGGATALILTGIGVGLLIYWAGHAKSVRRSPAFIGGETLPAAVRLTGTGFYQTVQDLAGLRQLYAWAEEKFFDLYEQGTRLALWFAGWLQGLHTGILTLYLTWFLFGMVVLVYVLTRS